MWRRIYLLLLLVRLYFAISPSYIHPDEHFQGPEVIAGDIFGWHTTKTWEFTTSKPIRSIFPLWAAYGLPMQLLHLITGDAAPNPMLVYYMLRILFFLVSFVLEDWALQELVTSPKLRRTALLLLSSSYVTWTYQTHTFSNAVETVAVVWTLVLIQRISKSKDSALIASALLGCITVFGVFNRITFPAFIVIPMLRLVPHYFNYPLALIVICLFAFLTSVVGIYMDTLFYTPQNLNPRPSFLALSLSHKVITPLNNLLYNFSSDNLSLHGLHPRYTHLLVNLPQLLGPATIFAIFSSRFTLSMLAAISGITVLSIFPHQEARFLMPIVPLVLSSIHLPRIPLFKYVWIVVWVIFNSALGGLMGVFHQGGVVPTQSFVERNLTTATTVIWWKTYSPPTWLLGEVNERITTIDLMGADKSVVDEKLEAEKGACAGAGVAGGKGGEGKKKETYLVAPVAADVLGEKEELRGYRLEKVWVYKNHLNLDDLDFDTGRDGLLGAVGRVIENRGLAVWRVVDLEEGQCDKLARE